MVCQNIIQNFHEKYITVIRETIRGQKSACQRREHDRIRDKAVRTQQEENVSGSGSETGLVSTIALSVETGCVDDALSIQLCRFKIYRNKGNKRKNLIQTHLRRTGETHALGGHGQYQIIPSVVTKFLTKLAIVFGAHSPGRRNDRTENHEWEYIDEHTKNTRRGTCRCRPPVPWGRRAGCISSDLAGWCGH